MTHDEDLLYIEDDKGRKLYYRFTPAAFVSNFAPLLIILHDEGKAQADHFEYKMWNILTPIDNFTHEKEGAVWLGEKEDFFVKDLLQKLIKQFAYRYECDDHIYLFGKGMGGYGAILHGILCQANAVYADTPKIKLATNNITEPLPKAYNLSNFLNPRDSFPIFYLCDENGEETAHFADECRENNIEVHTDFCPEPGEGEDDVLKEVLSMFEKENP